MGERNEVTIVGLSAAGHRHLIKALTEANAPLVAAVKALAPAAPPAEPDPFAAAACPPWTRDEAGRELVAFLDSARALRWVGGEYVADVPNGWRPLLVGPPVSRDR